MVFCLNHGFLTLEVELSDPFVVLCVMVTVVALLKLIPVMYGGLALCERYVEVVPQRSGFSAP